MSYNEVYINCITNNHGKTLIPENANSLLFTFKTETEADEFAAKFPKYCKARRSTLTCYDTSKLTSTVWPTVVLKYALTIDRRTGNANETAEKRRAKIIEILNQEEH